MDAPRIYELERRLQERFRPPETALVAVLSPVASIRKCRDRFELKVYAVDGESVQKRFKTLDEVELWIAAKENEPRTPTPRAFQVDPVEGAHGESIRMSTNADGESSRLVQTSSSPDHIWVGDRHRLTREEARELGARLILWADAKTLRFESERKPVH